MLRRLTLIAFGAALLTSAGAGLPAAAEDKHGGHGGAALGAHGDHDKMMAGLSAAQKQRMHAHMAKMSAADRKKMMDHMMRMSPAERRKMADKMMGKPQKVKPKSGK